jgi:hypothetical protein
MALNYLIFAGFEQWLFITFDLKLISVFHMNIISIAFPMRPLHQSTSLLKKQNMMPSVANLQEEVISHIMTPAFYGVTPVLMYL